MLKDPRWDSEPSLAGFALFVAGKDQGERYRWTDCTKCAVGQYLDSIGRKVTIGPIALSAPLSEWGGDLDVANGLARGTGFYDGVNAPADWTFGDLADRVLAYQMREGVEA